MSKNGLKGVWGDARRYHATWAPDALEAKGARLCARLVAINELHAEKTGKGLLPLTLARMLLLSLPALEKRRALDS